MDPVTLPSVDQSRGSIATAAISNNKLASRLRTAAFVSHPEPSPDAIDETNQVFSGDSDAI